MSLRKTYTSIFLSSFIIFSVSLLPFSYATDTLTPGQTLKDGQTLVSAQGAFELGFFSPGNSSYRYVGIWYHNISILTVVWVANRGSPLTDSTGSLALIGDGNLVVRDGRGNTLWSTNSSSTSSNPMAQLLDSGNLVVNQSDGTRSWQSFDHPTDTFIPGMKLSLNRRTGKNQLFTSWKSPNDPSIGNYSLGLDPEGSAQVFMWEGSVLRWRSGQWDGQTFIGTMMRSLYLYGFKLTNDVSSGIMSFVFEPYNSTLLRFVMQYDGVENTSMLLGEPSQWQAVWVQPVNDCEIYGKCGKYGWCSPSSSPICSCLKGFEPSSSQEWNNGNWSGGCVRRTQLACELNASATAGDGDGFSRLEGVKLPDRSNWATTVRDPVGCESFCLNNCSCKAYAYVPTIGCLTWGRDLIDIYQFSQGGNDLFVKLAASEFGGNSRIWIAIVIPISGAVFILIACLLLWRRYRVKVKDWWKCRRREDISRTLPSSRDVIPDFSVPSEVGGEEQEVKGSELPLFSFETLATATSDFSESNKLGQGGFGHVYKGELPGGEVIAVKRLSTSSGQGMQEFMNEVMLIAKLQHRNLVKLLGCCIEGEEKMLIYEYMPNKSLDALLFDPSKQELLDWKKRFNIIEGIARGLLYLHQDSRLRVVHRDLKASNILLDENLNPKISDFGMARIFGGDQNQENTNRVVGTFGYMSPEYAMEGIFSVKSDVYSFGVLILEIVTGRKNNSFHHLENSSTIVGHAWSLWNGGKSMELVDPSLRSSCSTRQVLRCIHVGLLCVQDRPSDRPEISSVLLMLGGENAILRIPKQPTFISERDPNETATLSTNDVTITILSGR